MKAGFFLFWKSRSLQCCKYCCGLQESARPPPKKRDGREWKVPGKSSFPSPLSEAEISQPAFSSMERTSGAFLNMVHCTLSFLFSPSSPHFPALLFFIIALAPALRRNGGRRTRKSKERKTEVDLPSFLLPSFRFPCHKPAAIAHTQRNSFPNHTQTFFRNRIFWR